MIGKLWRRLRSSHPRHAIALAIVGGGIGGILFWGGFHTALELTNTEDFCISCHEMRRYGLQGIHHLGASALQERFRRPRLMPRLPRAEAMGSEDRAQDRGERRVVLLGARQHSHAREVRGQSPGYGQARLGEHDRKRFARMPQLPFAGRDGLPQDEEARGSQAHGERAEGRRNLHLLPQGHRPQACPT